MIFIGIGSNLPSEFGDRFKNINLAISFLQEKGILSIEEWIPGATEIDRDGDVYLNRIYSILME